MKPQMKIKVSEQPQEVNSEETKKVEDDKVEC